MLEFLASTASEVTAAMRGATTADSMTEATVVVARAVATGVIGWTSVRTLVGALAVVRSVVLSSLTRARTALERCRREHVEDGDDG